MNRRRQTYLRPDATPATETLVVLGLSLLGVMIAGVVWASIVSAGVQLGGSL